jgi:hypothetical protein
MKIAWVGIADSVYWNYIAKYCVPSWTTLPGDKFIIQDSPEINIKDIQLIDWLSIYNKDSNFLKNCIRTKPLGFWRKMQSQVWAINNLKEYDWIVLLDTDVEIINYNHNLFLETFNNIRDQNFIWGTGESQKGKLDAGHIIVNMKHPDVTKLFKEYENIWESGKIFELARHYDGHAVDYLLNTYPSYKIKNRDYGTGFHVYDIGTVHYGSKLPKAIRSSWKGTDITILIEEMKVDKFKFIDEYKLVGKF